MEITNPLVHKNWNENLLSIPEASIFFTRQWAKVLADSFGYMPAFFLSRASREIDFLLPLMEVNSPLTGRRGIALPFTDFCAPYAKEKSIIANGISEIISHARSQKWKYVEIRGGEPPGADAYPSMTYLHHELNLAETSQLYQNLSKGHRRNIKKAQNNHLTVSIGQSEDNLETFFKLNCLTRKKHGLPPQPKRFFENFYKSLVKENMATLVSATYQQKPVAAAVFLHFKDQVIYKYGASDPKFLDLRANHLVMWKAINYFAELGFKNLSFGKTEPSNIGLRRFKLGFGAQENNINYYKFSISENRYIRENPKESGLHTALFRRMPVFMLRILGEMLYRHVA